jgi:hypothetical protein
LRSLSIIPSESINTKPIFVFSFIYFFKLYEVPSMIFKLLVLEYFFTLFVKIFLFFSIILELFSLNGHVDVPKAPVPKNLSIVYILPLLLLSLYALEIHIVEIQEPGPISTELKSPILFLSSYVIL